MRSPFAAPLVGQCLLYHAFQVKATTEFWQVWVVRAQIALAREIISLFLRLSRSYAQLRSETPGKKSARADAQAAVTTLSEGACGETAVHL
jgi:hypothetical protein